MNYSTNLKLVFAFLFFPLAGYAQVWINGMVADSATLAPLPNVNIKVKDKLMQGHALSEEKYYELLAIFNNLHKDIIYELGDSELTSLIFTFYVQNTNKK